MKHFRLFLVVLAAFSMAVVACAAFGADDPAPTTKPATVVTFDDKGLSSLQAGGVELLTDSQLRLQHLLLGPKGNVIGKAFEPVFTRYLPSSHKLEQVYQWGTISCTYTPTQGGVELAVELQNTGSLPITQTHFDLMQLRFPATPKGIGWKERWTILHDNPDALPAILAIWDQGALALCNDDAAQDAVFGFRAVPETGGYAIVIYRDNAPVKVGETARYRLSIRTAGKGATPATLAGDVYAAFAKKYPFELKWEDRRPIATAFLASSLAGYKANPRGWLKDPTLDTTTDVGRVIFRERMMKFADETVKNCKLLNAQGVIVWDVEGQEMPHATSYLGDPRMLPSAAPEMDAIADDFFARFTQAGLRTGVTIRPTHLVPKPGVAVPLEHVQVPDPVEEMSQKIAYAQKRWGCTIFYIDSNVFEDRSTGKLMTTDMPAELFQKLARKHPGTLLIPEHKNPRYWAYTGAYAETRQGSLGTSDDVRAVYPRAFTVLRVVDGEPLEKHWNELVASVRAGDVLLFRPWWNDPVNDQVKKIYEEAAKSR